MAPLVPYIDLHPLHLFGPLSFSLAGRAFELPELSIKPFGTLVAIGVYLGTEVMKRHGKVMKVDPVDLASFTFTGLVAGFLGGHMLDSIFYHPHELARDPLSLLRIWDGQSSFGGFIGAFLGLLYWKAKHKRSVLRVADAVASGFPAGWVFGRMGCAVAHDHPGLHSDLWFAVKYPGGGRFDLGLYEMLFTIPLALAFLWLARKPRPQGFFLGAMCVAYAPVRFAFDFLRAHESDYLGGDPRYAGLTPAQWACFVLLGVGLIMLTRAARAVETGADVAYEPDAEAPPTPAT